MPGKETDEGLEASLSPDIPLAKHMDDPYSAGHSSLLHGLQCPSP